MHKMAICLFLIVSTSVVSVSAQGLLQTLMLMNLMSGQQGGAGGPSSISPRTVGSSRTGQTFQPSDTTRKSGVSGENGVTLVGETRTSLEGGITNRQRSSGLGDGLGNLLMMRTLGVDRLMEMATCRMLYGGMMGSSTPLFCMVNSGII